jgi:hypothetical protein
VGAWGTGSFENDDGLDWVAELEAAEDTTLLLEPLQAVTQLQDDYLDSYECTRALAAAEVVAALRGQPATQVPPEVEQWVRARPGNVPDQLVHEALLAIQHIRTDSEAKELWDETDSAAEWYGILDDLDRRLRV